MSVSRDPHYFALTQEFDCREPWDALDIATPAYIWRSRNSEDAWAGLGVAGVFSSISELQSALAAVELENNSSDVRPCGFVCIAFNPEAELSRMWTGFQSRLFILPRILLRWREGKCRLLLMSTHDSESARRQSVESLTADAEKIKQQLAANKHIHEPKKNLRVISQTDEQTWRRAVERIGNTIHAHEMQKVVLARCVSVFSDNPFSSAAVLEQLEKQRDCFVFACRMNWATFLGASPEMLFRLQGNQLETESLAGTRKRGNNDAEDQQLAEELRQSVKDRSEQELVTRFIQSELNGLCDEVTVDSVPTVRKLTDVLHLSTTIHARLKSLKNADDVLNALHPTPAVCGLSRESARKLISELETVPRGLYAGAVGLVDAENVELAVSIRSALLLERCAMVFAGAGIVEGSDAEQEWEETENKMKPMLRALGRMES